MENFIFSAVFVDPLQLVENMNYNTRNLNPIVAYIFICKLLTENLSVDCYVNIAKSICPFTVLTVTCKSIDK